MKTENNSNAVKAALAYKSAVENASIRLWEFGEAIHELTENAPHGAARRLAVALAQKTGKKSSSWEVEISRAKRCYAMFEDSSDAAYYTLAEINGQTKTKVVKTRRTQAVIKLEKAFCALSDAEVNALIKARKAAKKSSK